MISGITAFVKPGQRLLDAFGLALTLPSAAGGSH
jgi:hypothetical protein